MGSITIRIPDELEEKIEAQRGEKSKSDFYRDILSEHVNKPGGILLTTDDKVPTPEIGNTELVQSLEQQISSLKDQIADLRADKGKLMTLLNQEQALHMQTQRLLPPAPEQKKWWKFW